jgi:ketosteroid isomerase-like protein
MNKIFLLLLLLVSPALIHAQKSIDDLINAEKNFATHSVANGTKDAFLKFADNEGIVFDQGKAVNAIETWNKREKRPGVLKWYPQFAEIASSNDFGYTTGPWTFQSNASNDTIVARGQYTTVWHINSNGEWKFLLDLGVGNTPKILATSLKKIIAKKITGNVNTHNLLEAEQDFIALYKNDRSGAYKKYLSKQSIVSRNGQLPETSKKDHVKVIEITPENIEFTVVGSGIASTGDMAYIYGNTIINSKQENFLHIWRKEKQGWKIALEVLRY